MIGDSEVVLIAAMNQDRVIGRSGAIPWHCPADLRRFREITAGHPVVMGRKTAESLGRPLPLRRNIVVSRDPSWAMPGAWRVSDLDDALSLASWSPGSSTIFVIGGAQIYRQAAPHADRVELTVIRGRHDGDTFLPAFEDDFELTCEQPFEDGVFRTYRRPSL